MGPPKPSSKDRVRAYRERMRAKGLRPVTVWTLDRRSPEMQEQIRLDCEAIARAEQQPGDARDAAEWVYANTEAMLRELDEREPYDWGPKGPPV